MKKIICKIYDTNSKKQMGFNRMFSAFAGISTMCIMTMYCRICDQERKILYLNREMERLKQKEET